MCLWKQQLFPRGGWSGIAERGRYGKHTALFLSPVPYRSAGNSGNPGGFHRLAVTNPTRVLSFVGVAPAGHDDMMTGSQNMRRMFLNALGLIGLGLMQLGATATARAEDVPYTINPGDTLIITAFDDERLDRELMVLPDGSISYPVAGKIETTGKTVGEVQDLITKELVDKGFLQEGSVVSVSVGKTTGNTIYVLGQVKQPGAYTVFANVDVTQALSLAGGLTPFASRRNIVILRQENGKRTAIPFNYSKMEDGEELETNITLKSGDVIMVPD